MQRMTQRSDYFLWLTPTESVLRQLQALIDSLAREHGGRSFEPHITLLSRLQGNATDIETRVAQLAAGFAPFALQCPTLGWSDEYYRCLYINVETDPYLVSLYNQARAEIPHAVDKDFAPHISLVYGDLAEHAKLKIVAAVQDIYPKRVPVDRLSIYQAPGGPETWQLVKDFSFTGLR
jgi:2'-5' RNA ligase